MIATESVADAIRFQASGAAGGFDIDAGTNGFIVDTIGTISLDAAAASNFTATGAFDVTVSSTAGSVLITAGEAAADALDFTAAAGGIDVDVALQMNLDSSQAAINAVRIIASNAGGGIELESNNATVIGCLFTGNSTFYGGGVRVQYSSPDLIECEFFDNLGSLDQKMASAQFNLIQLQGGRE